MASSWFTLLLLAGPVHAQDSELEPAVEGSCNMEPGPRLGDPDYWGPDWVRALDGTFLPEVRLIPWPGADYRVQLRVFLDGGRVITQEIGPLGAAEVTAATVPLTLPSELDSRLAYVSVVVAAIDPATGNVIGHQGAERLYAWRDAGGTVHMMTEGDAAARVRPLADAIETDDGTVESDFVGREVTQ